MCEEMKKVTFELDTSEAAFNFNLTHDYSCKLFL